jgi:hypothetical protein
MPLGSASIFDDINNGYWDDGLDAIIEMAVARRTFLRQAKGAQNQIEFKEGDAVRVMNIRPKYLTGITGKINKRRMPTRRGDIMVDIDPNCWRQLNGRFGHTLAIPASSLERV